MSIARDNFLDRIRAVQDSLAEPLLIDRAPTDVIHNRRARLLRNGLMVVAFNGLEDFLRERSRELLAHVSRTALSFADLPKQLVQAATSNAMKAAHAYSVIATKQGDDPVPILQQAASDIASTATAPLSLSRFALGHAGANVSAEEVASMLRALNAADAWNELTALSSRLNLGSTPLQAAYNQALRLRNLAAHTPNTNVQPSSIATFWQQALAVAIGYDILASRASRLIHDATISLSQAKSAALAGTIRIIFTYPSRGRVAVKREGSTKASRLHATSQAAWMYAIQLARSSNSPVVELTSSGIPARWTCTDSP